jgi:hypothetical protein
MFEILNSATIAAARRRGGRLRNQGGERRTCPPAPPCDLHSSAAGAFLLVAQPAPSLASPWLDLTLCGFAISLFVSTAWIIASREISGENERERERTRQIKEEKNGRN